MGFHAGAFAKVWSVDDKGKYSIANVSISRKNKDTNEYEMEFQDGFVRLVGNAHTDMQDVEIPKNGYSIKITSCDVTNKYDAEKKRTYTNYVIFGFEVPESNSSNKKAAAKSAKSASNSKAKSAKQKQKEADIDDLAVDDDDELPF